MKNRYEINFDVSDINKGQLKAVRNFFMQKSTKGTGDIKLLAQINNYHASELIGITEKVRSYFSRTGEILSENFLEQSPFAIFNEKFRIVGLIEKQEKNEISKLSIIREFQAGYNNDRFKFNLEFCIHEDKYRNGIMSFGIKDTEAKMQDIFMIYRMLQGGATIFGDIAKDKTWTKEMRLYKTDIESARDQLADYLIHLIE